METRTENRGTPPRAAAQSRAAAPAGLRGQSRGEGGRQHGVGMSWTRETGGGT